MLLARRLLVMLNLRDTALAGELACLLLVAKRL
jgi:hypothetical protein